MADVADLLRALASLSWPFVVLGLVLHFREDLRLLLKRITKARGFGGELELVQELTDSVSEQTGASLPSPKPADEETDKQIHAVMEAALQSPTVGIVLLARQLEKEAKSLLTAKNLDRPPLSMAGVIAELSTQTNLPGHTIRSLDLFRRIRNKVVHAGDVTDEEMMIALDSGITVYRMLRLEATRTTT